MKQKNVSYVHLLGGLMLAGSLLLTSCENQYNAVEKNPSTFTDAAARKTAASDADKAFDQAMKRIMAEMQQMMNQMEMTCDPDIDFARMMIMHHEAGIRMAEVELMYGHEPEAKALAEQTIQSNQESKERLEAFLASHGAPEPLSKEACKQFMKEMQTSMQSMMQSMRKLEDTPDPDVDFARMMIEHHEGAIDMANIELKYGDDEPAPNEARLIIEEQSAEIIELAEFINEHGIPTK